MSEENLKDILLENSDFAKNEAVYEKCVNVTIVE